MPADSVGETADMAVLAACSTIEMCNAAFRLVPAHLIHGCQATAGALDLFEGPGSRFAVKTHDGIRNDLYTPSPLKQAQSRASNAVLGDHPINHAPFRL